MLTIYSKKNCPFCDKAMAHLKLKNINFEVVKVDENPDAREFIMNEGHRSVPQIYANGKLFVEGGYQGLVKLSDEELFEKALHVTQ